MIFVKFKWILTIALYGGSVVHKLKSPTIFFLYFSITAHIFEQVSMNNNLSHFAVHIFGKYWLHGIIIIWLHKRSLELTRTLQGTDNIIWGIHDSQCKIYHAFFKKEKKNYGWCISKKTWQQERWLLLIVLLTTSCGKSESILLETAI